MSSGEEFVEDEFFEEEFDELENFECDEGYPEPKPKPKAKRGPKIKVQKVKATRGRGRPRKPVQSTVVGSSNQDLLAARNANKKNKKTTSDFRGTRAGGARSKHGN